jgi:uncharacterized membrane protein
MQSEPFVNIDRNERWASVAAGTMLAVAGLRRRSPVGALIAASGAALIARGSTGHCPAYARIDALRGEVSAPGVAAPSGVRVDESATINRPPEVLYEVWRTLTLLPTFIPSIKSVTKLSETRSHWVVTGPAGRDIEWDAEVVSDVPNQVIAWRSDAGADVASEGSVRFSSGRGVRETVMQVQLQYDPPLAKASAVAAWLVGKEPGQLVREALRRFKAVMESGEAPTTEGQPRGQQSVLNYD